LRSLPRVGTTQPVRVRRDGAAAPPGGAAASGGELAVPDSVRTRSSISRGHRSPAFGFYCAYAAFVAYATLLPFQFQFGAEALRNKTHWVNWDPRTLTTGEPTPLTDLVANVLFFMPLGFIGVHGQRRRRGVELVARSAFAGLVLSTCVEVAQFFTPERNPATSDVMTNTLGAALGAMFAVWARTRLQGPVLRRVRRWTALEPMLPLFVGFTALVIISALAPFDVAVSVSSVRHGLRIAQLDPHGNLLDWLHEIPIFLQYALLAGLGWSVGRRLLPWGAVPRLVCCILGIGLLAVGLEAVQVLVHSHVCSVRDAMGALAGTQAGIAGAALLAASGRSRAGWALTGVALVAGLAVRALQPFAFNFDAAVLQHRVTFTTLIPYSSYYYKATVEALADFMDALLAYVPLAFVLSRAQGPGPGGRPRTGFGVAFLCAGVALVLELLQLALPARHPEVSDILTAALGGGLGAYAWRWYASLADVTAGAAGGASDPGLDPGAAHALAAAVPKSQYSGPELVAVQPHGAVPRSAPTGPASS
jgi:VanZ family protein